MAAEIVVPQLGESVTEAGIARWLKKDGERVEKNEAILELETDKANVEIQSETAGTLRIVKAEGTVKPGEVVARIEEGAGAPTGKPEPKAGPEGEGGRDREGEREQGEGEGEREREKGEGEGGTDGGRDGDGARREEPERVRAEPALSPSRRRRLQQEEAAGDRPPSPRPSPPSREREPAAREPGEGRSAPEEPAAAVAASAAAADGERREPMTRLRKRIAERLVEAQRTAAILTTFNEVDLGAVQEIRARWKERFKETYGVSLGLVSFFARACVLALRDIPIANAEIRGDEIVFRDPVHLGIAVSTDRGLVVPVIRHAERLDFAGIEREIHRLAEKARAARLAPDDLAGGTFSITNGGVFGSLLSTPILNPPQSAILGLHKIEDRPVARDGQVIVRPRMYVALSYDHRLIDGKDSVTFLVRVKERIEDPSRLLLEL